MADVITRRLNLTDQRNRGRLSLPGDPGYVAATSIWAKPVAPMPRAVVHCRGPEDVQLAIRLAGDCDLPVSVRGGGHDWAGRALCPGIVIDLSSMRSVSVDPVLRCARIAGGARAGDVIAATDRHGLVAATGSDASVGMAGLTLGGGYGPLIARCGLALDNLLAAEVVLADGRIVIADDERETELFWALRGGGGNFGVVTRMLCRLHPLAGVHSGLLFFPLAQARAVMQGCAEIAADASDRLVVQVGCVAGQNGVPLVFVFPTWSGAAGEGERQTAPILKLGTVLAGSVAARPYGVALTDFEPYLVKGKPTFMESCWIPALDAGSIGSCIQAMETASSPGCGIITHEFRGAASRVPLEATAFGLRREHVLIELLAVTMDETDEEAAQFDRDWARATVRAFDPVALPGAYPNLLAPGDFVRATLAYGANAQRLAEAKRRYDPDNLFSSGIPLPRVSAGQWAVGGRQ